MNVQRMSVLIALIVCSSTVSYAADVPPMENRAVQINFHAVVEDAAGLAYDGTVEAEALYYHAPTSNAADLICAESFSTVNVSRGVMRLPLFGGVASQGQPCNVDGLVQYGELYVDILIDGQPFLSAHPLRSQFAAMRAEHAKMAQGFRRDLLFDVADIPQHSSSRLTTGTVDPERIPIFDASKIVQDTFGVDQIPDIDASKVGAGTFGRNQLPATLSADQFDQGMLPESAVPDVVLRSGDIGITSGAVLNGQNVVYPNGFAGHQCKVLLSLRGIDADTGSDVDQYTIYETSGQVTCTWSSDRGNPDRSACAANYFVICKK